jgi:hypothetical protein
MAIPFSGGSAVGATGALQSEQATEVRSAAYSAPGYAGIFPVRNTAGTVVGYGISAVDRASLNQLNVAVG